MESVIDSTTENGTSVPDSTIITNGSTIKSWDEDTDAIPRLQIVDEHQKFTEQLPKYMGHWGLADAGFKYNVVAVFGSQSTGKSTLLNQLFGTSFDVMNENQRSQTTKGIWISRGRGMHVLVMDVEGTDGRERGEDQDFERKSALFSMATSEVIILNLWEHQVGLYQGANMGLLKTVFEVNLQLFQNQKSKEKTLLLIVIRDHVGATPLENLARTLQADLEKIWAGLSKPEGLEDCKIHDYFDFMYTGLPHKILLPEKFVEKVAELRNRFNDPNDENYVFRPQYHKRIPADGYHVYASGIWDKILTNKDLDLPTQQELLAQYRCDEISNAAFEVFTQKITPFKTPILEKGQIISDLGDQMSEIRNEAVQSFDKNASRYHQTVYKKKRDDMLTKLNTQLNVFFVGQLKNLHKKAITMFNESLKAELKKPSYNFAEAVDGSLKTANDYFLKGAQAIALADTDWSFSHEHTLLEEEFSEASSKARADEFKKMSEALTKQVESELSEPVSLALNNPQPETWKKIIDAYNKAVEHGQTVLTAKAKSFNSSDEELDESFAALKRQAWVVLRKTVDEELADNMLLMKLRAKFEGKFRYDEHDMPRVWKPEDDIDSFFKRAKDDALTLVPLFAKIDLTENEDFEIESTEEFDFKHSLTILSETKQIDITSRFKRESDAFYLEAKRSVVATTAKVPMWLICLLIALGWNEFMAIIKSPIYLIFFVMCITFGYVIYALNLWGPLERILTAVAGEATRIARDTAAQNFAQPMYTENERASS
ncbi:Dynamin-like GTPase that mediates homotypic ER fusion [Apophysomyces sp. BC1034]|nr:Dynamin-like GTPase that mediates homotypic ER fusion [Apophysomyces sp. BC1015]KAG0173641.1 Dynamin-like GTPase that mediates homotypic ER fusion [Apophysomyces sp. BC1021]KAG0185537.1 Dynamin-like GTPase that mediates homotypic ER fusion [Apophysomyces sp. BC1034]